MKTPFVLKHAVSGKQLVWALTVILIAFANSAFSQALQIRRGVATNELIFDYQLTETNGVFSVLGVTNLLDFGGGADRLYSGPITSVRTGQVVLSNVVAAERFFKLLEDPFDSFDAYAAPIPDVSGRFPLVYSTLMAAVPAQLLSDTAFSITIFSVNEVGARVPINGIVLLSLVKADGTPWQNAYTITPPSVELVGGRASTNILITTGASLVDVFLAGTLTGTLHNMRGEQFPVAAGADVAITFIPCAAAGGWQSPLSSSALSTYRISGTFGEWPGHSSIHFGHDVAAPAGTPVLAAKAGRIVKLTASLGCISGKDMIVIAHSDGTASRYLHTANIRVVEGQCVSAGEQIAEVGDYRPCVPVHLHFETSVDGIAVNPQLLVGGLVLGEVTPPRVFGIHFRKSTPAIFPFGSPERLSDDNISSTAYVLFGIRDEDFRPSAPGVTSKLAPRYIYFSPQDGPSAEIDFYDELDVELFYQRAGIPGYPKLQSLVGEDAFYQFWFPWTTDSFRDDKRGPRKLTISAQDAILNLTSKTFEFGPRILQKPTFEKVSTDEFEVKVVSKLGPLPSTQGAVNPKDQLIVDLDNLALHGYRGGFLSPDAGTRAVRNVTAHDMVSSFRIKLDRIFPELPSGTLRIEARSGSLVDIADEVKVGLSGVPRNIVLRLRALEPSPNAWALPAVVTAIPVGSGISRMDFTGSNGKAQRGSPSHEADSDALFYPCNVVTGFPQRLGFQAINRTGGSSFIAVKSNAAGTQKVWICASVGAVAGANNWEYQIRYFSGDPTLNQPESMRLGTVPNSDIYISNAVIDYDVHVEYGLTP